jgi:hypothetical protein
LAEGDQEIAIVPSIGWPACRYRMVTMIGLIDPVVGLDFSQITNRGSRLSKDANEFSAFLKTHMASWAGDAGIL